MRATGDGTGGRGQRGAPRAGGEGREERATIRATRIRSSGEMRVVRFARDRATILKGRQRGSRLTILGSGNSDLNGGVVGILRDHHHFFQDNGRRRRLHGEAGTLDDELPQLRDGDPLQGVTLKDPPQDGVQLGRERENGLEEIGVLEVRPERGIFSRSPLPWVAATGQIDQNHAQGPDIIRSGQVAWVTSRGRLLTF